MESLPDGRAFYSADFIRRVATWEANHLKQSQTLLQSWAENNRAEALAYTINMSEMSDVVGSLHTANEGGFAPLDCAIRANNSGFAAHMLEAGCRPNKPYLTEERSPKMLEVLEKYTCVHSHGRCQTYHVFRTSHLVPRTSMYFLISSRCQSMIQGKNAFQAAKTGDLISLETYALIGYDFTTEDGDGKQPLHYAVEGGFSKLFQTLGVH